MKCTNCGAEISNELKNCPYCDCEIIKPKETQGNTTVITTNNYYGGEKSEKAEANVVCPKCQSRNIKFKREETGNTKDKFSKQVYYRTVAICQDCGNTWNANSENKSKHGVWFWILAVLFFPISLSIWFYKTDKLKLQKKVRIIILAIVWLFLLAFGSANSANSSSPTNDTNTEIVSEQDEITTEEAPEVTENTKEAA